MTIQNTSYDISREPCIPVVQGGRRGGVSLRDALVHAHEYAEVQHEVPILEFGLYRLLGAFVLDIFFVEPNDPKNPLDTAALEDLLQQGHFDAARIDAYLEKYRPQLDLFSEKRPFLQTAGLTSKLKPIASMLPSIPSGTNAVHFHRAHEDWFAVSPPEALALLASMAPFMTAGGAGLSPSINGAPPVYVLIQGTNLFETLCLNLAATPPRFAKSPDVPAWRSTREPGGERQDAGHVESLTWRPRRVQLVPEVGEEGLVLRTIRFEAGDSTRFEWRDPNAAYRLTDDGAKIIRMRENRELWRDAGPLVLLAGTDKAERPLVVTQFSRLKQEGVLPRHTALAMSLYGMRTYDKGEDKKMKVFEWQREYLNIPAPLLLEGAQSVSGQEAHDWLESAELVAYQLRKSVKKLHPETARNDSADSKLKRKEKDLKGFLSRSYQTERSYWSALRGVFEELIAQLAEAEPTIKSREALRLAWRQAVEDEAKRAFERAADGLSTDSHALERATKARRTLLGGLKNVFDPSPPGEKKKGSSRPAAKGAR